MFVFGENYAKTRVRRSFSADTRASTIRAPGLRRVRMSSTRIDQVAAIIIDMVLGLSAVRAPKARLRLKHGFGEN